MHQHPEVAKLLASNVQWAGDARAQDSDYFAKQVLPSQNPDYLWIGCSDSRVVEALITGFGPGVIFTQRNIANQFHLDDSNAQSVLAYAIDVLKVPRILVVGHTDCGGVKASLEAAERDGFDPNVKPVITLPGYPADAPLNRWLEPLTLLAYEKVGKHNHVHEPLDSLIRDNVRQQMLNLSRSETVAGAWKRQQPLVISGYVYDIAAGALLPVAVMDYKHAAV
ncbi:hypothetical protein ONZ45_g6989 [Pleurotus djamor]|nr:hypothetical protein ONZ45_g6989 [Pleurotus djamor]